MISFILSRFEAGRWNAPNLFTANNRLARLRNTEAMRFSYTKGNWTVQSKINE